MPSETPWSWVLPALEKPCAPLEPGHHLTVPRGPGEERGHVPHQVIPSYPNRLSKWGAVAQGCPCLPRLVTVRWSPEAGTSGVTPELPVWPRAPRAGGDVVLQRAGRDVWGQPRAHKRSPCSPCWASVSGDRRSAGAAHSCCLSCGQPHVLICCPRTSEIHFFVYHCHVPSA